MSHNYVQVDYSRTRIKKAGKTIINTTTIDDAYNESLIIINNWRAAHSFPLQIIYMHLKKIAPQNAVVAQRLKRLYSITQKLSRFPNMSLTTMQDIGGCRVIVKSIDEVYSLVDRIKISRMRHEKKEEYDYIKHPKDDGYRSYHLVLSYQSDRNKNYNGLLIEVQIRTHLQHIWATAVETMDTYTGDTLKIGGGSKENKEFFLLVSQLFEVYEQYGYSISKAKESEAAKAIKCNQNYESVIGKLKTIKRASKSMTKANRKKQDYFVLILDKEKNELQIKGYSTKQLEEATNYYDSIEKEKSAQEDAVLVSTSSEANLSKAYPNYFADVSEFIELLEKLV